MTGKSEIAMAESDRLKSLGIPYEHINCCDDQPVVIVDPETMQNIVKARQDGNGQSGLFVC